MKKIIIVLIILILLPTLCFSDIAFTDNKWETTFDCVDATQQTPALNCDGMSWGGDWFCASAPTLKTTISIEANNPLGSGKGMKKFTCDGDDNHTGTIGVTLPTPQKELWIRFYHLYEEGFAWDSLIYDKSIYLHTASGSFPFEARNLEPDSNYTILAQNTSAPYQVSTEYGWAAVNGGQTGDGKFHCFEIYIKLDTNQTDGIGRIWIDGILRAENTSVDWSNGDAVTQDGIVYMDFLSNQLDPSGGPFFEYFDDLTIVNNASALTKRDVEDNLYIGPITQSGSGQVSVGISGTPTTVNSTGTPWQVGN